MVVITFALTANFIFTEYRSALMSTVSYCFLAETLLRVRFQSQGRTAWLK